MEVKFVKNKFSLIVILIIICILAGISMSLKDSSIIIKNDTNMPVCGLKIMYSKSNNEIKVPSLSSKEKFKTKLEPVKNFTEDSIIMIYTDSLGKRHEEYLEAYIEKGSTEKISVIIDSVDAKGVLSVKTKINRGILWLY